MIANEAMADSILTMDKVSKAYSAEAPILKGVSFQQKPGEFVAVVGPSGCGKTTMLRCIAALMQPDEGKVLHNGKIFSNPPPWLSIVFQDYNRSLFPWSQPVPLAIRQAQRGVWLARHRQARKRGTR